MEKEKVVTTIEEALSQAGVNENTLSENEKKDLDEKGFIVVPNFISQEKVEELRNRFEEIIAEEGKEAGAEVHQEKGTRRLSNTMNKGKVFDDIYMHPKLLAAMYHMIGRDFKVSAMNGRDVLKGQGLQKLHEDWNASFFEEGEVENDGDYRKPEDPYNVANSLVMLDDFNEDNGPTRVVPGTHKKEAPQFYLNDREAAHPEEVKVLGKAGDAVIFNSHLWHGGTNNISGEKRRVLHPYYVAREFDQQQDQRKYIKKETYERISPAARYLLDVQGAY